MPCHNPKGGLEYEIGLEWEETGSRACEHEDVFEGSIFAIVIIADKQALNSKKVFEVRPYTVARSSP